jgi:hypothetical protein
MFKKFATIACASLFLLQFTFLESREPYHAMVSVDNVSENVSASNLVDLKRDLGTSSLEKLIPIYTPVSAVSFDINLRGIQALTSFAAGSTTLVVQIPQTGKTLTFTGTTRDDSLTLFRSYLNDAGNRHNLLKLYARYSPIDPIAGNPNSLLSQMAQADYLLARLSPFAGCDDCWNSQPIVHQFQAGTFAGRSFTNGYETTSIILPLRYSYSPCRTWAFIIDAPAIFNINGGAYSLTSSIGVGLQLPLTSYWYLTPTFRAGAGGSLDLVTSGSFVSSGLSSTLYIPLRDWVFNMTNYIGYYTSTNLWLSGIDFNYNLHNWIFKNGFALTSCKGCLICNIPIHLSIWGIDSYFAKDRLYMRHYDEVGFSLISTCFNPCLDYDCLSVGFSYQFGQKNYRGYFLNLAYQF